MRSIPHVLLSHWKAIVLAVAPAAIFGPLLPVMLKENAERQSLQRRGVITTGAVAGYKALPPGGKGCKSQVEVAYEVAERRYSVVAYSCGVSIEHIPIGRKLDVRYDSAHPETAEVMAPSIGVESSRSGMESTLLVLVVALTSWWGAYAEWKRAR